ncbi:proton-conducting transporter membrane subunit [Saliphagus sp. GCM10025317]
MSSLETLVVLLIVAPILLSLAPIALGLRYDRVGWPVATITTAGLFAAVLVLASDVFVAEGTNREVARIHVLGNFEAPMGIELVADPLSTLIALLITGTAFGVLLHTRTNGPRGNTFYTAYLLLVGGLLGITLTGDVFNLFVFLEITSLATYALVASGDGPESAVAALKYLILGTVAASLYLMGVGLLFMGTGTLNMADLAATIPELEGQNVTLARAGLAFIVIGFAIKVAQWPLHSWQPDAYQHAPDGVTPVIAALVSTASAYALGRVLFGVYGPGFIASTPNASAVVVTIGCLSVVAGSTLAVIQRDVMRLLAYSSVSQFGLIVAAYGVLTEQALSGALIHLVGHGLTKAGLFVAVGWIAIAHGARTVDEYAGLAGRQPFVAGAMAVLLLSLVGIPPSVGFVGKWYIAIGAVEAQAWPVAAVILFSTMLTLAYVARLLETMYVTPPIDSAVEPAHDTPAATDGGRPGSGAGADAGSNHGPGLERARITTRKSVPFGTLAVLVLAAVLAVALGFAGELFVDVLTPFLESVLEVSS